MNKEELQKYLKNYLITKNQKINGIRLKKLNKNIIDTIYKLTDFCEEHISLSIRIKYIIIPGLSEYPKCEYCKTNPKLVSNRGCELHKCCSIECSNKYATQQTQKTMLKKYNTKSFTTTKEFKEKTEKTIIKKYGVDRYVKSEDFKTKSKKTKKEKYNSETFVNPSKAYDTQIKENGKYGLSNPKILKKYRQTCLNKYGVDHPMKVPEIFYKQQQNCYNSNSYKNIIYRGTFELYFLKSIDKLGILNKIKKSFYIDYTYNNGNKRYFPDFILQHNEIKYIIEIKSIWTYDNCGKNEELKLINDTKFEAAKNIQGYKFIVLFSFKDIDNFLQQII